MKNFDPYFDKKFRRLLLVAHLLVLPVLLMSEKETIGRNRWKRNRWKNRRKRRRKREIYLAKQALTDSEELLKANALSPEDEQNQEPKDQDVT